MARLCENVRGCPNVSVTAVPAFMGVVRLCGPCVAERAAQTPSRPRRVVPGSYVRIHRGVGVVNRVTPDGWYVVERVVRGAIRTCMVDRGKIRPV